MMLLRVAGVDDGLAQCALYLYIEVVDEVIRSC